MTAVPTIYTVFPKPQRASWPARLTAGCIAVACLAVLLIAAWLDPASDGTGTHIALGLNACAFKTGTGLPCISCGMTTSFSLFVRGNLLASLWVQPAGTGLALAACAAVWLGGYTAVTGRPVDELLRRANLPRLVLVFIGFLIVAWAWKLMLTVTGHDGW
ncbi:MAG: DUF2752 domain-containing protein [Phycisphaerae bacterium]